MNKIRIIDLLTKIANGEELPEKIKYKDIIYNWKVTEQGKGYCNEDNHYYEWLANRIYCDEKSVLNDTIEIIEDKENIENINIQDIEELEDIVVLSEEGYMTRGTFIGITDKINELVQAVKHLEKTKEDK